MPVEVCPARFQPAVHPQFKDPVALSRGIELHLRLDAATVPMRLRSEPAPYPVETLGAPRYFLPTTCLAAATCCFYWAAALALTCFCAACFCTDFGDLSPILTLPSFDGLLPAVCSRWPDTGDHNRHLRALQTPYTTFRVVSLASDAWRSTSVLSDGASRFRACLMNLNPQSCAAMNLTPKDLTGVSFGARLAQLVEHYLDTVGVAGSSPAPRTMCHPRVPDPPRDPVARGYSFDLVPSCC